MCETSMRVYSAAWFLFIQNRVKSKYIEDRIPRQRIVRNQGSQMRLHSNGAGGNHLTKFAGCSKSNHTLYYGTIADLEKKSIPGDPLLLISFLSAPISNWRSCALDIEEVHHHPSDDIKVMPSIHLIMCGRGTHSPTEDVKYRFRSFKRFPGRSKSSSFPILNFGADLAKDKHIQYINICVPVSGETFITIDGTATDLGRNLSVGYPARR